METASAGSGTEAVTLGLAEMWFKYVEKPTKVRASVKPHTAIAEPLKLLDTGELDLTWAPGAFAFYMSRGVGPYKKYGKRSFYMLFKAQTAMTVIFTTDPNIKSVADWKGKRVTRRAASPTDDSIRKGLFEFHGMTDDDVKLVPILSTGEGVRFLKEGVVDVVQMNTSIIASHIAELAEAKPIYFIPLTDGEIDSMLKKVPWYFRSDLPAGSYKGQDAAWSTIGDVSGIFTRSDFDEVLAYEMVKAVLDHEEELLAYHASARYWSLDYFASLKGLTYPFHPATVKYFKERKVWTAEHEAKQKERLEAAGL
jgi:TRAP transporter TAXI family solute receptor